MRNLKVDVRGEDNEVDGVFRGNLLEYFTVNATSYLCVVASTLRPLQCCGYVAPIVHSSIVVPLNKAKGTMIVVDCLPGSLGYQTKLERQ